MTVLVTDGNQRSTLAVVRALGREGIAVAVGETGRSSLAGASRYCAKRLCYPSPLTGEASFLSFLLDEIQHGDYKVLIPMSDVTMQLISSAQGSFSPHVRVPFPGPSQVGCVQDKRHVLLLARQVGIPVPETCLLREDGNSEALNGWVSFPAVLKPRFSRYCRNGTWVSGTVRYVRDAASLQAEWSKMHQQIPCPLVQEKIDGEGRGVFLLVWNGELKAALCHRRVREKPPWGGVSVCCESLPLDHALVEKSFALLKAMDWQGVAMVEFKVDRRDGQAKLMEVNGRFWGSLELCLDAGMNFPLMLYRLAMGEDITSQFNYGIGMKSRWLLGDLDSLILRFTHAHELDDAGGPRVSKARAVLDFLKLGEHNLHYDVFRMEDPRPAWSETKAYISAACRGLVRKSARK